MANPDLQLLAMRIVTKFTSADQFVDSFHVLCTDTTCFIPTTDGREVGTETGFSVRLADGTPMLRGLCTVKDVWATAGNPYQRPGVLLEIRLLTADSIGVFHQLQMLRSAVPREVPDDVTLPQTVPELETVTIQMPALFLDFTTTDEAAIPSQEIADGSSTQKINQQRATLLGVAPLPRPPRLPAPPIQRASWFARLFAWLRPRPRRARHRQTAMRPLR